jgi:hypothetical protein
MDNNQTKRKSLLLSAKHESKTVNWPIQINKEIQGIMKGIKKLTLWHLTICWESPGMQKNMLVATQHRLG